MRKRRSGTFASLLSGLAVAAGVSAVGLSGSSTAVAAMDHQLGGAMTGTLTVYNWQAGSFPLGKAFKTLDANFEKMHPGVKVVDSGMPFNTWETTFRTAFTTHTGDVFFMLAPAYLREFSSDVLPLNSYVTTAQKKDLLGWNAVTVGSPAKIYGLPYNTDSQMFFYNKAVFKAAHIAGPPGTFAQFLGDCKTLKAAGYTPLGGGAINGGRNLFGLLWSSLNTEAEARALGAGDLKWTDPKVKAVMELIVDMQKAGCFSPAYPATNDSTTAVAQWQAGKVGMIEAFMSYEPLLLNAKNTGFFELSSVNGKSRAFIPFGTSVGWSISRFSSHQKLAWEYISYITSAAAEQVRLDVDAIGPTNTGVNLNKSRIDMKFAYNYVAEHSHIPTGTVWTSNVLTVLQGQLDSQIAAVLTKSETVDQALQEMQSDAEGAGV